MPQPSWPPQLGWGQPRPPIAPQPNNGWIIVAIILVVTIAVMGAGIVAIARPWEPLPAPPIPTPSPASPTPTPAGTPNDDRYWVPGPPDLNPNHPAWPQPDQIKGLLEQNPLYNQVIPTADCALRQIDLPTASIDALEQYLNDVMACLMYVWYTPVYDAGYQMPRPSVTVYSSPTKTPCGQVEELVRAYYCPTNQQIYFGIELMTSYGRYSGERAVVLYILAHEYAHAVQYRTQILGSQLVLFPNADSEADAAESNRRLELQADCWSGAALNAMRESLGLTNTEQEHAVNSRANAGDPTPDPLGSHGSGPTGARWLRIGFGANSPGTCNTWIVPYDEVT